MKVIAGLGNPGPAYAAQRHNVGFMIVDALCEQLQGTWSGSFENALGCRVHIQGTMTLLLKPQSYMNLSGASVAAAVRYHRLDVSDLLVVHDDLDLALGRLKFVQGAGHGGHNGVRSVIECLGSSDFCRLRVGIGRPPQGRASADYVLAPFAADERVPVQEMIERSLHAVECFVSDGLVAAQNQYH